MARASTKYVEKMNELLRTNSSCYVFIPRVFRGGRDQYRPMGRLQRVGTKLRTQRQQQHNVVGTSTQKSRNFEHRKRQLKHADVVFCICLNKRYA